MIFSITNFQMSTTLPIGVQGEWESTGGMVDEILRKFLFWSKIRFLQKIFRFQTFQKQKRDLLFLKNFIAVPPKGGGYSLLVSLATGLST